jgi:hypothetical protein
MRIGGTVIEVELIRTRYGYLGATIGWPIPTLFPGARPGLPVSFITYLHVCFLLFEFRVMIGFRVPKEVERGL